MHIFTRGLGTMMKLKYTESKKVRIKDLPGLPE